ncbi:MAG TPA: hypothetical protein PLO82_10385 [Bacteroidia bacterium]|nr:hypothetical protein [Bacteroidia bacterium]
MKVETGKNRLYTGKLVTSENYSSFTQEQRNFWNKAHRAFMQGKMYFKYNGMNNIVPFKFSDGSFDTVLTKAKYDEFTEESKKYHEQVIRTADGGQGEPVDTLATNIE